MNASPTFTTTATGVAVLMVAASLGCENQVAQAPVIPVLEEDEYVDEDSHVGEYFIAPSDEIASEAEASFTALAAARRVIFMNRGGGTFTPGNNNSSTNISSVPSRTSTIPAYEGSEAQWQELMTCIKSEFARFNVEVTDVDPGAVAHVESVMGGNPQDLGLPSGVGGVAPVAGDCRVIERAVVYTFTKVFNRPRNECEVAAQEISHAFGLDHEFECRDPMTYLSGCGNKDFQNVDAQCGEFEPRQCMCGGGRQNSVALLTTKLGAALPPSTGTTTPPPPTTTTPPPTTTTPPPTTTDTTAPTVEIVSPAQGAQLVGNTTIQVKARASDASGISKTELLWQFNGQTSVISCAAPQSPVLCTVSGDTSTWSIPVGTGSRTFSVRAVDGANQTATTPTRTISLLAAPPAVQQPTAAVTITSPGANTNFTRGAVVPVRAKVENIDVGQVRIVWTFPGGSSRQFTLSNLDGTNFGSDFSISSTAAAGSRTLRVDVTDRLGKVTSSSNLTINIVQ